MRKQDTSVRPIEFRLSQQGYQDLAVLKERLRVPSKTEAIRLGLCVLSWVVEELEEGHKILVQKKPGLAVELSFPFLNVKPKRSRRR